MAKRNLFHTIQRKRYHKRSFRNPYAKDTRPIRWKPLLIASVSIGLFVVGTWYVLTAPRFLLTSVDVQGTETIPPEDIRNLAERELNQPVLWFFSHRNRVLFSEDRLRDVLLSAYVFADLDMEVEKQTLTIRIQEKTSHLLWQSGDNLFLVGLDGVVIRALTAQEHLALEGDAPEDPTTDPVRQLRPLPKFIDVNTSDVAVGSPVFTQEEIDHIFRFQEHLVSQGIPFSSVKIDRLAGKWMSVATETGYDILFDPDADIDAQALHLATVLRERGDEAENLEYIDLRFGDHVYVK